MYTTPNRVTRPTYLEDDVPEQEPIPYYLFEDEPMPPKRARSGSYRAMDTAASAAVGGLSRKAIRSSALSMKAKGLRKAIKKEVDRLAEKRTASIETQVPVANASWPTFANQNSGWFTLSPYNGILTIQQGSTQGSRTGNKIRIAKAKLTVTLWPQPYDAVSNTDPRPQYIKFWFVRPKAQANTTTLTINNFFQNGGSASAFSGALQDLSNQVNAQQYNLLGTKMFKVGNSVISSPGNTVHQLWSNNDFPLSVIKTMDITKYLYKQYDFNDSDNTPANDMTVMFVEAINADGSAIPNNVFSTLMRYRVNIDYVDF